MKIKGLLETDTVNYKKTSMFVIFPTCKDFKCNKEAGCTYCQNTALSSVMPIEIDVDDIIDKYITNGMTHALVCAGLEPFDTWSDLKELVGKFRKYSDDDIVIYTGYYEKEITNYIEELKQYDNILIKFGRYIPDQEPHYDENLGVKLASNNQYSKWVS